MKKFFSCQSGFTLIELLALLTLVSLLFSLSFTQTHSIWHLHRMRSAITLWIEKLNYAKHLAMAYHEKLIFCPTQTHLHCGGDWKEGQLVTQESGKIVQVFPGLPPGHRLVWNSSGGTDHVLVWLPNGHTQGQRGSFYYSIPTPRGEITYRIVVLNTGRMYVLEPVDRGEF